MERKFCDSQKPTELFKTALSQTVITRHVLQFKLIFNCNLVHFLIFLMKCFMACIFWIGEGFWRRSFS